MKTQYVRSIPVNNADFGSEVCRFTGTLSWDADMGKATIVSGTLQFADIASANAFNTSALLVDENSKGGVYCLYC